MNNEFKILLLSGPFRTPMVLDFFFKNLYYYHKRFLTLEFIILMATFPCSSLISLKRKSKILK
jgi:hypothetical protein